jgi:aromatic-L-amino-acid decarboxylase
LTADGDSAPTTTLADAANLEFTADEMHAMSDAVASRIIDHIARLSEQPAAGVVATDAFCRGLRESAPETGVSLDPLLADLFDQYVPRSFNTAGPGYFAYIPAGGLFPAALADFISNGVNRFTGIWLAAPALVQLEANVLDWFRDWMGFPPSTRGLLTTGSSMATFNAIVCARERHLGADIRHGVVYASSQAHHCVQKSARLAGIQRDRIRSIPVDAEFRMRTGELSSRIAADRAMGLRPFLVVSSAGTTNTGAVDPLDAVADICASDGLWHHVDGAYGAFFHMCEELRPLLAGLSRADSLALDPHKGLFLPYGTGALLVREGAELQRVHAETADYMPGMPDADAFYDPSQHGPDLSRGFPGLRVWLCVKMYGARRLRTAILEKRTLALEAAERIGRLPGIAIAAPPQLSLFAFHLARAGATLADENAATRAMLDRVVARQRVMVSGCQVDGRFLIRVCVLSFRTRRDAIDRLVDDVRQEAEASSLLAV